MGEHFWNRLNLKGLVDLVSNLCWMEVAHGGCCHSVLPRSPHNP